MAVCIGKGCSNERFHVPGVAIARDRGSERARKACGAADYPIGPCGALLRCIAHAIARLAGPDPRTTY
jgi:hypothetical protein